MSETPNLRLPLVAGGQAQKHVTVNEALSRLDALSGNWVDSFAETSPPDAPSEGSLHLVGPGAVGAWAGHDGELAFYANGGWAFAGPARGRRLLTHDGLDMVFDGEGWVHATGDHCYGAGSSMRVAVVDHVIEPAAASETAAFIPDKAIVLGVTARVIATIEGPGLTSWRLGVAGAADRYGSGMGLAEGSFGHGVTSSPMAYYGGAGLRLEGEGGTFASGLVRLCAHFLSLSPPR